jgi:Protein of unknown function (DUF732)
MRTTLAVALLIAAVALLADLLLPADPAARADTPAPAAQERTATLSGPDAAFLSVLAPGTELEPGQAAALVEAADRVCEGVTAAVPVVVMADTVAADLGLSDTEARHLVNTAATTRCAR